MEKCIVQAYNVTGGPSLPNNPFQTERIVVGVVLWITAIVGFFGNAFVILVILSSSSLRRCFMNILLINLALADLANIICCLPDFMINMVLLSPWTLGNFMCRCLRCAEMLSIWASVTTQVAICIERYFAINHPMQIRTWCTRSKESAGMVLVWSMAIGFSAPMAFLSCLQNSRFHPDIMCATDVPATLKFINFLVFYIIPGIIFIVLYSKISFTLWQASQQTFFSSEESSKTEYRTCAKVSTSNRSGGRTIQKRKQLIKTLLLCVVVYLLCYSPIQVLFLARYFNRPLRVTYLVQMVFNVITYMSSAANPVVYVICMPAFRRRFLLCFGASRTSQKASLKVRFKGNSANSEDEYADLSVPRSGTAIDLVSDSRRNSFAPTPFLQPSKQNYNSYGHFLNANAVTD